MSFPFTIAVDFDGVIHAYTKGYNGGTIYDEPMLGCKNYMDDMKARGWRLIIYTARANPSEEIAAWLSKHEIPFDEIVKDRKPIAHVYLDDRAVRFESWPKAFWEMVCLEGKEMNDGR